MTLLTRHGVPAEHAHLQTDLLVEAEIRGLPSHGAQRLPRVLKRIDNGLTDPQASGDVSTPRPSILNINGARGLGPVVMMNAICELKKIVSDTGMASAGIQNANHIGMLAYYAEAAAADGLIAIIMSTSEALVHPYGGTDAMLGTNPIAIGIPTGSDPFVLDLATSLVSMGKIHHHALRGEPIPAGWAVDAEGRPTTKAEAAKNGAIAPFGEAKGYGLGLAVELLVSVLAGSAFAPEVHGTLDETHQANKGDLIILIDPDAGAGSSNLLSAYLDRLRNSHPLDPEHPVLVPGDGARSRRAASIESGIDLPETLFNDLQALAGN
jgi:LDH2 family malate/lactate/ureidoglycolate dehydrogenase